MNLVHPRRSCFTSLQNLVLYNCEISVMQAYLISNDFDECHVNFSLRYLNLSHNQLSYLINYAVELGLVNNSLQQLILYNC